MQLKNKKIKIFCFNHIAITGGAELALSRLFNSLPHEEFEIIVVAPETGNLQEILNDNITFEIIGSPSHMFSQRRTSGKFKIKDLVMIFFYLLRLRKAISDFKPDVVLSNSIKSHVLIYFLSFFCRFKWIVWLHDSVDSQGFSKLWIQLLSVVFKRPGKIFCVSEYVMNCLHDLGVEKNKTEILYNSIQIRENIIKRETDNSQIKIGMFGRLTPIKGHEFVINSFPEILDSNKNCHLYIYGDEFAESIGFKQKLIELIELKSLSDNVHLMGFTSDPLSEMNKMEIILNATVVPDSFPTVLLEGLMLNKKVISSDKGGSREILENGKLGKLYDPSSNEEFINSLNMLIKEETSHFENGKSTIIAKYNIKVQVLKFENYLKKIIHE